MNELEQYRELRAQGHPSPILKIAETWLRAEINEKKALNQREKASGPAALQESDPLLEPFKAGGGFSAGRMAAYDYIG